MLLCFSRSVSSLERRKNNGEKHEGLKLKKDLDELADEEVCFIYENREEEVILKRDGDTLEFLRTLAFTRTLEEDEIKRIFDWKVEAATSICMMMNMSSPEEAKIRDAIRAYITSENEEEEALSMLTSQIWDEEDAEWECIHEAEVESVCPDSPVALVNENGRLVRIYPYWKWKSHAEDYQFIPTQASL